MEAGEGNDDNISLKRQRIPLSDSEDNVLLPPGNDGQKRRRLESAGRENQSPKPSSSGRVTEQQTKADTPMVPSVRSRVQLLTWKQDGATPPAKWCLPDPGADSPTVSNKNAVREQCLGVSEFHQRMERFNAPVCQASPAPTKNPASASPRASSLVTGIQQKLQCCVTPSSQQASNIREERKLELSKLQPISENAWLKRSNSDPSLTQVDNDAKIKDGSFIEIVTSSAEKKSTDATGKEVLDEMECKAWFGNKGSLPSSSQAVLKLSFSEDQRFSSNRVGGEQNEVNMEDDTSLMESTLVKESEVSAIVEETKDSLCASEIKGDVDSFFTGEERVDTGAGNLPDTKGREVYLASSCDVQAAENHTPKELEPKGSLDDPVKKQSSFSAGPAHMESCKGCFEGPKRGNADMFPLKLSHKDVDGCTCEEEVCKETTESLMVQTKYSDPQSEKHVLYSGKEREAGDSDFKANIDGQKVKIQDESLQSENIDAESPQHSTEAHVADIDLVEGDQCTVNKRQEIIQEETNEKTGRGESSKKVAFILEPEVINESTLSESSTSLESTPETRMSEMSSHDENNTAKIIDQMFEEVLEYADRMDEEREENDDYTADHDGSIGACSADRDTLDTEPEEEREKNEQECEKIMKIEDIEDELLTFPPSGILSPLSKSVEAVVTPLWLTASQESNPPPLVLTTHPAESAPLYSVDAYRTQRQTKNPTIQCVTPGVQKRVPPKSQPQPSVNSKEKITALNEEAEKLQTVISQTLQALSFCTDEEHGRGSLEEAEAEKLLLVSCEKRSALLAEISRLREERNPESGEASEEELHSQQPCRGTVAITNIRLPLKVEFVCSSHNRQGRPSHYFFILIRYGPCNIVATPLATAADAQNGDTISFATSVTLKDIRSSFEIDVEVYSLSHTSASCTLDRATTKSRVTPRKLLNTITRSSNGMPSAATPLNPHRSSNFCLVGSHKITLASLGLSKFPLDKIKLEGKIRRLLGDEFQEKVPFLSPLEGHIYLQLNSKSHSVVHYQGFLTMFELISGYGVWNRRYFVLKECAMYYWNYPNDKETKEAEGCISLSSSSFQCVRPVQRDVCARPFTFELVSDLPQQQDDTGDDSMAKCWLSADTKQERLDWMEKLSQVLLDFHTWNRTSAAEAGGAHSVTSGSGSGSLRESIL